MQHADTLAALAIHRFITGEHTNEDKKNRFSEKRRNMYTRGGFYVRDGVLIAVGLPRSYLRVLHLAQGAFLDVDEVGGEEAAVDREPLRELHLVSQGLAFLHNSRPGVPDLEPEANPAA